MAFDKLSTPAPAPVVFTADSADFETVVRVMMRGVSVRKIKNHLEWFYSHGQVVRPENREPPPSNVVRLGEHRQRRRIESEYGPAAYAALLGLRAERRSLMTQFAISLEAELETSERIAARRAAKKARK